jgi:hypothetical protein
MSHNIDDTSWETLFWSLMEALEQIPHPVWDADMYPLPTQTTEKYEY